MKNYIAILIVVSTFIFGSCNNNKTLSDSTSLSDSTVLQNDQNTETIENSTADIIDLYSIKVLDEIDGMTVNSIEIEDNYAFTIYFKGDKTFQGELIYNEFEESYFFSSYNKLQIKVKEDYYPFLEQVSISNIGDLLAELSNEDNELLKKGNSINLCIIANEITSYQKYDNGMLGAGEIKFVSLN